MATQRQRDIRIVVVTAVLAGRDYFFGVCESTGQEVYLNVRRAARITLRHGRPWFESINIARTSRSRPAVGDELTCEVALSKRDKGGLYARFWAVTPTVGENARRPCTAPPKRPSAIKRIEAQLARARANAERNRMQRASGKGKGKGKAGGKKKTAKDSKQKLSRAERKALRKQTAA